MHSPGVADAEARGYLVTLAALRDDRAGRGIPREALVEEAQAAVPARYPAAIRVGTSSNAGIGCAHAARRTQARQRKPTHPASSHFISGYDFGLPGSGIMSAATAWT